MATFRPSIQQFHQTQQTILTARVDGIRAAIQHAGEKGHSAEIQVRCLLRDYLPAEYGLGTGFIAYRRMAKNPRRRSEPTLGPVEISRQVDIIVYDALRCGPLIRLEGCDVFPIEAVFGYVEVKTSLRSAADIRSLMYQSSELRKPRTRLYHSTVAGSPTGSALIVQDDFTSIRSFVFCLDAEKLGSSEDIVVKLEQETKECRHPNAFFTGLYLNQRGYYAHYPVSSMDDPQKGSIIYDLDTPLQSFMHRLLVDLSRFPRIPVGQTPALGLYDERADRALSRNGSLERIDTTNAGSA